MMNDSHKKLKIGLYGRYGWGSLGDAANQAAIIENIRKFYPDAQLHAICPNPQDAEERFKIPAYPISRMPGKAWPGQHIAIIHLFVRIFLRIPLEFSIWFRAFRYLKGFRALIFSGGGQLDDYNHGPFRQPYDVFRWCLLAKLRGVKIMFVAMGAGPIDATLSKQFYRAALSLASYRSYRDQYSKQYVDKPVVSISYHNKDDSLMQAVGQGEYTMAIEHFEVEPLIKALKALESNCKKAKRQIAVQTAAYKAALAAQYEQVFNQL